MHYSLLHLFFVFMYVGAFTIGGGMVAITLMQQVLVGTILTGEEFFNMVAISESTPGPIGINIATYVGFSQYGVLGAIVTTAGEVLPSIVCIIIISHFFMKFHDKPVVLSAFSTLRPATTGMIMVAALGVFTVSLMNTDGQSVFQAVRGAVTGGDVATVGWLLRLRLAMTGVARLFVWRGMIYYVIATVVLFRTKLHPVAVIAAGAVWGAVVL